MLYFSDLSLMNNIFALSFPLFSCHAKDGFISLIALEMRYESFHLLHLVHACL